MLQNLTLSRWAAKEAAIKTHSSRRLFPREVSVLTDLHHHDTGAKDLQFCRQAGKPRVLIDPPMRLVMMDDRVARLRGLRLPPVPPFRSASSEASAVASRIHDQRGRRSSNASRTHQRRSRVAMQDRREADASLSHDGEYAVAVCQALDEAAETAAECITDNGQGQPLHEPEYGDLGFADSSADELVGPP